MLLAGLGAAAMHSTIGGVRAATSRLKLSVLTDEISQDFGHACEVAAREFGLGLVDLREAGGKNIMNWDAAQIAEVRRVLERFNLRVACLATPVFKVDWPGAPKSPFSPARDEFGASFSFDQQQNCSTAPSTWRRRSAPIAFGSSISGASRTRRRIARRSTM